MTLTLCAVVATAWAWQGDPLAQVPADRVRYRVESLRIDPVGDTLTWTVSRGTVGEDGTYGAVELLPDYQVNLKRATMSFKDEERRFSAEEAVAVRQLLGYVGEYARESTEWWRAGKGEPVKPGGVAAIPPVCGPEPAALCRP